jgi:hypothetical protein
VIPTYSVSPHIRVRERSLKVLAAEDVVEAFLHVRDYRPVIDIGWDEVVECVEAESRWLDRASGSVAAKQFDAVLDGQPATAAEDMGISTARVP